MPRVGPDRDPSRNRMPNYVLEILDGDRAGDVLPVTDRALRVGRKPGNDLVLADEKTSGVHAEIVLEGDRHVLRDLGSTNGTFLDGKRITEIVLTPGDVVTFGRLRLKFRDADAPAAADAGELAVRRLDTSKLSRRGGSVGLLAVLLVVGLGVAGWLWWRGQDTGSGDRAATTRTAALVVDGNRLAAAVAACEGEDGWNLRGGGVGFQPTTQAHTGQGAFEALGHEGAGAEGDEAPGHAVATLQEPLAVFTGRTMTIAAHVRTEGSGMACVRAVCFANNEQSPFRFRVGTPLRQSPDWQRVEAVVAVPPGCDRLQVELVAVLPSANAAVLVDDVAVVEGGTKSPIEHKLAESSQTLLGTGSALAVRSVDTDDPATLLAVLPDRVPAPVQGLVRADLCALSDLGRDLVATPTERSFQFEVSIGEETALGADHGSGVQLLFPADAANGLMIAGESDEFVAAAAESEFTTTRLLVGDRATRALLRFEAPVACRGQLGGGVFRLRLQAARFELVLGFRSERQEAGELVRRARAQLDRNEPGRALDSLRTLVRTVPMDTEVLAEAQALRTQVLVDQAASVQQLRQDLDRAEFFDTRGGFERVVRGLDDLVARHGEHNLEDGTAVLELRQRATARLAALDAARIDAETQRLRELAAAFAESDQKALARVVEQYVQQHLEGK